MDPQTDVMERSPLIAALLSLGVVRAASETFGLVALLVVAIAAVGACTIGAVVLRLALLR